MTSLTHNTQQSHHRTHTMTVFTHNTHQNYHRIYIVTAFTHNTAKLSQNTYSDSTVTVFICNFVINFTDRPTESELLKLLEPLVDWKTLARHLPGITESFIEQLNQEQDISSQKSGLISKWVQMPQPSWKELVIALLKANETDLVHDVVQYVTVADQPYNQTLTGNK